jgi:putative ATP-binding cassette transporter
MKDRLSILAAAWAIARPYWFSEDRWRARGLLAVIVAMNLTLVGVSVMLNQWNARFYDALQNKDQAAFLHEIMIFCGLAALYIVIAVYQVYLTQMLQIRWRRWMTEHYLTDWLSARAYYRLELAKGGADNPDQRIADDLRLFVADSLSLSLGLLREVVTLFSFLGILWSLSGALSIPGLGWEIPGYLVWAALLYAILGTWLTHKIGRPLIKLNFDQQRFEADFRFGLVRLRENAEGIALYRGEKGESAELHDRFGRLITNWWGIMSRQKKLSFFTVGYSQIANVFPFVVAAPRYFAGDIQLGGLMQTASAFGSVQGALSWIIDVYSRLAEWTATINRLTGLQAAIAQKPEGGLSFQPGPPGELTAHALRLALPDGRLLVDGADLAVRKGERVLVSGPSGSGKSTLFRALAGIWPYGAGHVVQPAEESVLYLPQRPYLPLGDLRRVVSYPSPADAFEDAALREALAAVDLADLGDHLDQVDQWARRLSPGEQQRLAFARVLLQKPDWLFLDEATAALDPEREASLYQMIQAALPGVTIVSIGHRAELGALHTRKLWLDPARRMIA